MRKELHNGYGKLDNFHIFRDKDELEIELVYPPRTDEEDKGKVRYVLFDQESVRASDGIRIHYDFTRDGYVIEQASRFCWNINDKIMDPDWQEVAFIQAWGREESEEEKELRLAE